MSQNQNQIPDKVWADIAAACDRIGQSGDGAVELAQALDRLSNAVDPEDVAQVRYKLDQHKLALQEWLDKTEWVQKTAAGHELGMHRVDVLKQRIENLSCDLEAALQAVRKLTLERDLLREKCRELEASSAFSTPPASAPAPAVPEIDYEALIHAAFAKNAKWAQGTAGCIAFARGAEWFRDLLAATPAAPSQETAVPHVVKPYAYGGCTGINDYLMSDGSVQAMTPDEAARRKAPAAPSQPVTLTDSYAGVITWIGDKQCKLLVTEDAIKREHTPGVAMRNAAHQCAKEVIIAAIK